MTLPPNQRIREVMYLITTAITANKIIAAVVVLAVMGSAASSICGAGARPNPRVSSSSAG